MKNVKAERYDWAVPGDMGKYCLVPVDELLICENYQRRVVSEANTLAIAKDFDRAAFGVLIVMRRKYGQMFVVDGQQRLSAVKRRGDMSHVPCLVFESKGQEHEARAFVALNINRKRVTAVERFRAAVAAGVQPESEISDFLASIGIRVTEDGKDGRGVSFPAHLLRSWKLSRVHCQEAIQVQLLINNNDAPLHHEVHNGIYWLLAHGVSVGDYVDKIIRLGGRSRLLESIRTVSIETGMSPNMRTCGVGILRVINHRRRGGKIVPVGSDNE